MRIVIFDYKAGKILNRIPRSFDAVSIESMFGVANMLTESRSKASIVTIIFHNRFLLSKSNMKGLD